MPNQLEKIKFKLQNVPNKLQNKTIYALTMKIHKQYQRITNIQ